MQKIYSILGLIGIGIAGRLLPHLPNATPITAITLTARRQLGKTWVFLVPIVTMLLSDIVIGFYDWRILVSVYASFFLIGCMSLFMRKSSHTGNTILYAVVASIIFFLVTNFAVWTFSPWYEKSISGLIYCYILGLPFMRNMLVGDIFFSVLLLKGPEIITQAQFFFKKVTWSKTAAAVMLTVLCLFPIQNAFADTSAAQSYLDSHAQNPWVTMALSVLGETPNTSYLNNSSSTNAIDLEAPILALAATHQDSMKSPFSDHVIQLRSYYANNQIGDPTLNNDDVFGILALISSGESPQDAIITTTVTTLLGQQNTDGGWSYSAPGTSDTNTTAAAIMALNATGHACNEDAIIKALAYLHNAQNSDGGFPYDPKSSWGTASDASSDAWTLFALNACGIDESSWTTASSSPKDNLLSYQASTGYFEFQHGSGEDSFSPVTTAYAIMALSGKTLPVVVLPSPQPEVQPVSPPIASPSASSGGGGGGVIGGGPLSVGYTKKVTSTPDIGQVLGTSTQSVATTTEVAIYSSATSTTRFLFENDLRYGMESEDVTELQKRLIQDDLLPIVIPSGWFGPLTLHAVKEFQSKNEIPSTGYVGPMTRRTFNSDL